MADLVNEINKIPIVTRALCLSLFGTTIPAIAGLVNPYRLLYTYENVFYKLQV
jgi:hypothetical protein